MFSEIYYSKKTGEPVQVVAKCSILPDEIPGICFQQMSGEFACYVWDVEHFKANYQKEKVQIKEETETDQSQRKKFRIWFVFSMRILTAKNENIGKYER